MQVDDQESPAGAGSGDGGRTDRPTDAGGRTDRPTDAGGRTDRPTDAGSSRRRLAEIRCGFAELARREAQAAENRVEEAKRRFDDQLAVLAAAQAAVDLGSIHGEKEEAHRRFRKTIGKARKRAEIELAATAWLAEINRVNSKARGAQLRIQRERDAADAVAAEIDRLTAIADATREMAESAAEACRAAQGSLAAALGEEAAKEAAGLAGGSAAELLSAHDAAQGATSDAQPAATPALPSAGRTVAAFKILRTGPVPAGLAGASMGASGAARADEPAVAVELRGPKPPLIVRLLLRDNVAMSRVVEGLAGGQPEARRRWQLCLSNFVDAVVATAIDNGDFTFVPGNPFWDQLTPAEAREVARGLAALGYRYDGMGGFADGRLPGHRELSMALGQAGLLTVRVRHWPRPEETAALYRSVRVDPVALVAAHAPAVTMGELVRMLGRRAEMAADLWNDWARARPLLLAPCSE